MGVETWEGLNDDDADDHINHDDYNNSYNDSDDDDYGDNFEDGDDDQDRESQGRLWRFATLGLLRKIGPELLLEYNNIKSCC